LKGWQKNTKRLLSFTIYYEIFMIGISLAIVLLSAIDLIVDFNEVTSHIIKNVDYMICIIFAFDLIINLIIAKDKIKCLKASMITIIAVVPFSSFYRIAGVLRLGKLFSIFTYANPANIGILSKLWIFIMKPSVIRISKFGNMARSYFSNSKKSREEKRLNKLKYKQQKKKNQKKKRDTAYY